MRGGCWDDGAPSNVSVQCTLLQQLSQELLLNRSPAELNTGCDSSDCFICQGQRHFCNQDITDSACPWMGRARQPGLSGPQGSSQLSSAAVQQPCSTEEAAQLQAAQQQQQPLRQPEPQDPEQGRHKRAKHSAAAASSGDLSSLVNLSTAAAAAGGGGGAHGSASCSQSPTSSGQKLQRLSLQQARPSQQHQQQPEPLGQLGSSSALTGDGSRAWQWQPEFASLQGPAPARFAEVAWLLSAEEAASGHCVARRHRISGLEFSPDGQLLAAAGVSKQVGLYQLAPLAGHREAAAPAAAAQQGCLGSSSSSQRQQRQQQQWPVVPLLQPVATVRLPGKVSSIAFSPDMQGVISIGDYDGTLTQVHVASGHYLNEVDAHAGRRIWSVCHSTLRPHFAVTASDDCTTRLWAGSGLNTAVATITAPGRPAVCGADFSSSNEHLLALAASDSRVYLYDLRQLGQPLATLHGHRRPVSYAKFFGSGQLVSASIDGTLAVWDLAGAVGGPWPSAGSSGSAATAAVPAAASGLGLAGGPAAGPSSAAGSADAARGPSPASSTCGSSDGSSSGLQQQKQQVAGTPSDGGSGFEALCSSGQHPKSCCTAACTDADTAAAAAAQGFSQQQQPHQQPQPQQQPWKVFRGHTNEKNFVGLSVDSCSGLMAVGSETSEVFSYHTSWSTPLATFDMATQPQRGLQQQMQQPVSVSWKPPTQQQQQPQEQQSVSAVAWRPSCAAAAAGGQGRCPASLLAAATSTGVCRLLSLLQA